MKLVFAVIVLAGACAGLAFFIGIRNRYHRAFMSQRSTRYGGQDG